jgi:hypothetical protein
MVAVLATLFTVSCNKEPNLIGLDLLPGSDRLGLNFTDTSSIVAYTIAEEPIITKYLALSLAGHLNDEIFGKSEAEFYTQFNLSASGISFGDDPVVDSIVLTLVYYGVYGDSVTQHTFDVYRINEDLIPDTTKIYYSNSEVEYNPEPIGTATFVPNFKEADSIDGKKINPHLRITLSSDFGQEILNSDADTRSNNEKFVKAFKGLLVKPQPVLSGVGSIISFNLLDDYSRVNIFYHKLNDTIAKQALFPINSTCVRYNKYNHFEFAGADSQFLSQLSGNTTSGDSRVFLQGMSAAKVELRIPYLGNISKVKKMAVNEAILVLSNENPDREILAPSALLGLRAYYKPDSVGSLRDETIGSAYFGGRYVNDKEYRFRVTKYVQDRIMNPDAPDYGLTLFISGAAISGSRVVLRGPGSEQNRMKLLIYYTELD